MTNFAEIRTNRHHALRSRLREHDLGALLVTYGPNLAYLTGLRASAGAALVTPEAIDLVIDSRYETVARSLVGSGPPSIPIRLRPVERSYDEAIAGVLSGAGRIRVGVEAGHMTLQRWQWLGRALDDTEVTLVPTDGLVEAGRLVKDEVELERFRTAGAMLGRVARRVIAGVTVGRPERALAADIEHAMMTEGFEERAFPTIVASGPNSALPHARPTDRPVSPGELLLLDFGGVHDGYCVDLSRTICVGAASDEARRLHAAVSEAQREAIATVRPGIPVSEVDAAARAALDRHGLADAFRHATGHGLGLEIHEAPRVGRAGEPGTDVQLEVGMVFTVEPGVYLPGVGGVRIEDDVVVTPDGRDMLTDVPRGLETGG